MKRALVTGAAGFVGRWLSAALLRDGWEVTAAAQESTDPAASGVDGPWGSLKALEWRTGDLRDDTYLRQLVADARPDAIVHLAAVSQVAQAGKYLSLSWEVNLLASVRLLSEVSRLRESGVIDPTVLLVGSAEQYGRQPEALMPLTEATVQLPLTAYGATKVAQEVAGMQSFRSSGVKVIAARPFPHSGAGQDSRFLIPALFARAAVLKNANIGGPMLVGNLTPVRDYLHVSDVVAAYISLLERGTPGEAYNVASGHGYSVQEVVNHVIARIGLEADIVEDPALVRAVDVPVLVGDATRLTTETGWRPIRRFDDILDDLFDYFRRHAATF